MKPKPRIEAIHIIALHIDANSKEGTPAHAEAVKLLEDAKHIWRDQLKKKCPHCGKEL